MNKPLRNNVYCSLSIMVILIMTACNTYKRNGVVVGEDLWLVTAYVDKSIKPVKDRELAVYEYKQLWYRGDLITPDFFSKKKGYVYSYESYAGYNDDSLKTELLNGRIQSFFNGLAVAEFYYSNGMLHRTARINEYRNGLKTCGILYHLNSGAYDENFGYAYAEYQSGSGNYEYQALHFFDNQEKWCKCETTGASLFEFDVEPGLSEVVIYADSVMDERAYELSVNDSVYINFLYGGLPLRRRNIYNGFVQFEIYTDSIHFRNHFLPSKGKSFEMHPGRNYFRCALKDHFLHIMAVSPETAEESIRKMNLIQVVNR